MLSTVNREHSTEFKMSFGYWREEEICFVSKELFSRFVSFANKTEGWFYLPNSKCYFMTLFPLLFSLLLLQRSESSGMSWNMKWNKIKDRKEFIDKVITVAKCLLCLVRDSQFSFMWCVRKWLSFSLSSKADRKLVGSFTIYQNSIKKHDCPTCSFYEIETTANTNSTSFYNTTQHVQRDKDRERLRFYCICASKAGEFFFI